MISGGPTARLSPFLEVVDTAPGLFRKSEMGIVVPADDAGHVWGASRVGALGAYCDSISMALGHLIWQLREPAGQRRRHDWASLVVDESSNFSRAPSVALGWSQDPESVNVAAVSWRHID